MSDAVTQKAVFKYRNSKTKWWMVRELTGGVPSPNEPSTAYFPDVRLADMSTHQPLSARGQPTQQAENSDLKESLKEVLTCVLKLNTHSYPVLYSFTENC